MKKKPSPPTTEDFWHLLNGTYSNSLNDTERFYYNAATALLDLGRHLIAEKKFGAEGRKYLILARELSNIIKVRYWGVRVDDK